MSDSIFADDFFEKLNTSEAYRVDEEKMESFWEILSKEILSQTDERFYIGDVLKKVKSDNYYDYGKKGAGVSTVHNAENKIFIDAEHERRYGTEFNRKNYEGRTNSPNGDNTLHNQRKKRFQESGDLHDEYTGKKLNKDGRTNIDHVVSAKEIHENKKARLYMSDGDRNDMAVSNKNTAFVDESLNKSKNAHDLKDWSKHERRSGETNQEHYDLDDQKVNDKYKTAKHHINRTIEKEQFYELKNDSVARGKDQAKKQIIGLIMYYAEDICISEINILAKSWSNFNGISDRIAYLKQMGINIKDRLLEKLSNIKEVISTFVKGAVEGFIKGIVGTIVTTIINMFATTFGKIGKALQDGAGTIVNAFKLWATNPENLSKKDLSKKVIKMISICFSTTVGLATEEMIKASLNTTPLATFAEPISIVSGILISGCLSGIIIYVVDNFGNIIKNFKRTWDDIKYGAKVSKKEIINTYEIAVQKIDDVYQGLLREIEKYYDEVDKLAVLSHDMTQLASEQTKASINYARISEVPEDKILHNRLEEDKFFLG